MKTKDITTLTLTIQPAEDKQGKKFMGVFGTLITKKDVKDFKKAKKIYDQEYKKYSKIIKKDENSKIFAPIMPKLTSQNFVFNLDDYNLLKNFTENLLKEIEQLKQSKYETKQNK